MRGSKPQPVAQETNSLEINCLAILPLHLSTGIPKLVLNPTPIEATISNND